MPSIIKRKHILSSVRKPNVPDAEIIAYRTSPIIVCDRGPYRSVYKEAA